MQQILIVEDDWQLSQGIVFGLKGEDYRCIQSDSVASAAEQLRKNTVDLILLDINLPDGSGMNWLRKVRQYSQIPIILISANHLETDIVVGLESGANDYLTKPFSLMVLRARIHVWLRDRRTEGALVYQDGEYRFDFHKMEFWAGGRQLELSRIEQKLLRKLVENAGITLSRYTLTDEIWSGESEYVNEHALTVVMKRLRDKLGENAASHSYIKTVYGIGYAWINGENI